MALAANVELLEQEGKLLSLPVVASDIVYKGALVKINAAGYAAPAAPEAGSNFAGVAYEKVDNSTGAAGDKEVRVVVERCFALAGSVFSQADVGSKVYATDDGVITTTEGTTSKQIVGTIVKFMSATEVLVKLQAFSGVGASA